MHCDFEAIKNCQSKMNCELHVFSVPIEYNVNVNFEYILTEYNDHLNQRTEQNHDHLHNECNSHT